MNCRSSVLSIAIAVVLLLGSGVLQGIAWCASSICTTCGDNTPQNRDFDTALMGGASVNNPPRAPRSQDQGGSHSGSSRNFVKKGNGSE